MAEPAISLTSTLGESQLEGWPSIAHSFRAKAATAASRGKITHKNTSFCR
jgi:hypothetical protein